MTQSCHNSDLGINFLTEISPHEVSWDEHRSDAESVKILYNYSVELSKYADRINGCSGILKFGVNPDQGKLVLKQAFFCRVRHCPVSVSGADLYSGGQLCFSNCQIFRNAFLPIVGIPNSDCEKSACYRIA